MEEEGVASQGLPPEADQMEHSGGEWEEVRMCFVLWVEGKYWETAF